MHINSDTIYCLWNKFLQNENEAAYTIYSNYLGKVFRTHTPCIALVRSVRFVHSIACLLSFPGNSNPCRLILTHYVSERVQRVCIERLLHFIVSLDFIICVLFCCVLSCYSPILFELNRLLVSCIIIH